MDDGDNDAEGVFDGLAPTCVRKSTEYISSSEVQNSLHVEAMKACIYKKILCTVTFSIIVARSILLYCCFLP